MNQPFVVQLMMGIRCEFTEKSRIGLMMWGEVKAMLNETKLWHTNKDFMTWMYQNLKNRSFICRPNHSLQSFFEAFLVFFNFHIYVHFGQRGGGPTQIFELLQDFLSTKMYYLKGVGQVEAP